MVILRTSRGVLSVCRCCFHWLPKWRRLEGRYMVLIWLFWFVEWANDAWLEELHEFAEATLGEMKIEFPLTVLESDTQTLKR